MEEIRTEQQSGGIAIGKAVLLKQPDLAAERREITAAEAEKEQAAFRRAAEQVREALRPLARTNAIFAAHLDMAEDATLLQGVEEKIAAGKNAEWALEEETEELSGMLESLEDAYLRERAADVRDVCRRMMAALKGVSETSLRNITEKAILFAEELHPSDTAQMDFRYIRGMVTEKGGATSHVAILARSLEIPALLGVEGILKRVREGEAVILLGGEPAPLQAGGHRLAPPRLCHRRLTRRGQLLQVGLQGGPGLLQSGALGVKGLRLGQHPVPHLKLQRLVLRAVRVGDHMKAD
ncbi:MAG: hypothetical protein EGR31_06485, partial [Clostridium sp.]|nr:hypothetical protein [Clostridium sp.]